MGMLAVLAVRAGGCGERGRARGGGGRGEDPLELMLAIALSRCMAATSKDAARGPLASTLTPASPRG